MKQVVLCSRCGLASGRRWNIQRHINTEHGGEGEVLNPTQYWLKSQLGEIPQPNYSRSSGLAPTKANKNLEPSTVLLEHATQRARIDALNFATTLTSKAPAKIRLDICDQCFTYVISYAKSRADDKYIHEHECDLPWVMDQQLLIANHKSVSLKLLEREKPSQFAEMIQVICGSSVHVVAVNTTSMSFKEQMEQRSSLAATLRTRGAGSVFPGAEADYQEEQALKFMAQDAKLPDLTSKNFPWLFKLCGVDKNRSETVLNTTSLKEFLSITGSTAFSAKYKDGQYRFVLVLARPAA